MIQFKENREGTIGGGARTGYAAFNVLNYEDFIPERME